MRHTTIIKKLTQKHKKSMMNSNTWWTSLYCTYTFRWDISGKHLHLLFSFSVGTIYHLHLLWYDSLPFLLYSAFRFSALLFSVILLSCDFVYILIYPLLFFYPFFGYPSYLFLPTVSFRCLFVSLLPVRKLYFLRAFLSCARRNCARRPNRGVRWRD